MLADAEAALVELVAFPTATEVRIAEDVSKADGTELAGVHRLAALSSIPTEDGLREGLMKLVPSIARLVLETGLGKIRLLISGENDTCPPELLKEASRAAHALIGIGGKCEVAPLALDDLRDDLRTPGFLIPARDRKLSELREADEARFEKRLRSLIESDTCEPLPLIDNLDGEKIFSTIGAKQAPIGAFLPIYDRIYLMMSPGLHQENKDYYIQNYGLSENDFFAYARAGKVIPVFKFELGVYPERVWRRFAEDLDVRYISPRELDYACARYAWSSAEWLRILRSDRAASQQLFAVLRNLDQSSKEGRIVAWVIRNMLRGAETFEGEFWRRGHLAAGDYSPAMPLAEVVDQSVPYTSQSMAPIEVSGAAMHLSMGLALGASTFEGLVQNEAILRAVAQKFGASADVLGASDGARIRQVIDALGLAYSNDIPPDEYIDIVDQSNTRRIRELVSNLTAGMHSDGADQDVRERIQQYNQGVERIIKKSVTTTDITIVTGFAASAFEAGWLASLGVAQTSKAAGRVADLIDATKAGDALDWLRGKLNRVPKEAIRLYRIRSRLDQARRKS